MGTIWATFHDSENSTFKNDQKESDQKTGGIPSLSTLFEMPKDFNK